MSLEVFLGSALLQILFDESPILHTALEALADLPTKNNHSMNPNPVRGPQYSTPSLHHSILKSRNINRVSIRCGIRHPLRTD